MRALISMIALGVISCAEPGEVRQAQLDPGDGVGWWAEQSLWLDDGRLLAEVFVIGGRDVAGYRADTEYWYVDASLLGELGRRPLFITREVGSADPPQPDLLVNPPQPDADPPQPDRDMVEADPPQPDLQMFTMPVFVEGGWGEGFVRDALSGGVVMQSEAGFGLRLFMVEGALTRVVWYQSLPAGRAPRNITPEGELRVVSGFSPAEGAVGYAIDLIVE